MFQARNQVKNQAYLKIEKTYQHQINCNTTTKHFSKQNNQTINEITTK